MIVPKSFHLILAIWYAFSTVINAFDLSERLPPQGPLGVRLDYTLATLWPAALSNTGVQVRRSFGWSSHLKFSNSVSGLSDAQLWQMAHDAYAEMVQDMMQYKIGKANQPIAMSVLAFDNEIILASSEKGQLSFAYNYPQSAVLKTLQLCQITWNAEGGTGDEGHKNQGSCGEVMSTQMYYTLYKTPLADRKARICTVLLNKKTKETFPSEPCGTDLNDQWGCNLFVKKQGLTKLDISLKPEPYDLNTLTGRPDIGQIQVCEGFGGLSQN